ncbi:MAG: divergent polysaccharide deacetylase family protein [Proteobacteria bacterium]|nr:divergent polysaccharide deacetylase family protein [Pseudomonadota bacterium]
MRRRYARPGTLKFMIIAIVLMVLIDRFGFDGTRPYVEEARREARAKTERQAAIPAEEVPEQEEKIEKAFAKINPEVILPDFQVKKEEKTNEPPAWRKFAVAVDAPAGKPKIVIIIDDLGEDRAHTKEIIALPGPLTAAFLPYPPKVAGLVEEARQAGHEIMMHMPMEATDADLDPGAYVLRASLIPERFENVMEDNLKAFGGYVGINNHMGSRLTRDPQAMRIVMAHLHRRGLLFVDSRTTPKSVGAETAKDYGVPYASRDVFLDNDPDKESVMKSLLKTEKEARRKGVAIAIGHPKEGTIEALREWLPTLAAKGFILVPASAAVQ